MRTRELLKLARELGTTAGYDAACWCFDGNTPDAEYSLVARGIADGDPAIMDRFNVPNLSGEWADGPTPDSLARELGIDADDDRLDDVCGAWEEACTTAFWAEIDRACKAHA